MVKHSLTQIHTHTHSHSRIEYKCEKPSALLHSAVYSTAISFQSNFKWSKTFPPSQSFIPIPFPFFSLPPHLAHSICSFDLFARFTSMHSPPPPFTSVRKTSPYHSSDSASFESVTAYFLVSCCFACGCTHNAAQLDTPSPKHFMKIHMLQRLLGAWNLCSCAMQRMIVCLSKCNEHSQSQYFYVYSELT